jgi:uncharacterized protein YfaT (DUF1175 family)
MKTYVKPASHLIFLCMNENIATSTGTELTTTDNGMTPVVVVEIVTNDVKESPDKEALRTP